MNFVPKERADAAIKKILDERSERKRKEREERKRKLENSRKQEN